MTTATFVARLLRNPAEAEVDRFLQTRSGKQMVQLFRLIPEPAAQAALTARLLLLAPPVMSGRRFIAPEKAKKALNAFVGFRCYYISIPQFKSWPMKKLSNLIGLLWEADPNKSLWSLMAKAWSTIRDQIGKDKAPLDQFFSLICTHLKMPTPESYLAVLGWSVSVNEEGDPTISRDGSTRSACVGTGLLDIALSVEDIIAYVQSMGYASTYVANANTASLTFLGHSVNPTAEKSNLVLAGTPTVASTTDRRTTARNKRRAKRDFARATGLRADLEQDILNAHRADPSRAGEYMPDHYPTPTAVNYDPNPFYNQLVGYFDSPLPDFQDDSDMFSHAALIDAASVSNDILHGEMDDILSNAAFYQTDFDAFRPGANEDATLPAFDDIPNA
uniref:Mating-type protein MAT-1 n=3 Tax=Alternaria brassicicola TaxID=29001 RepID=D5L2S4_ALTBR|nr:MAT1 [Alternaria brassicicola]ADE44128.1 MAT1 [Alternaria brassicicola]BAJ10491.1 mating type protein MAT1-1-1 [Alternaria brassicicola]BAJ10492.1 mating type protein MAT1-1-1 [Alternaria brassicicola]